MCRDFSEIRNSVGVKHKSEMYTQKLLYNYKFLQKQKMERGSFFIS